MTTPELPAREAMEFDTVIVGAGPAGLAAAIRLKQLAPEHTVVVVEKGSEVGAHILSGAVIDPIGLDRLIPEWRGEDTPIKTAVTADHFYALGPSGALRLPNFLLPPLMSNHGNFIVSLGDVCRYLAKKAEALGVEIYPGFAAAEVLFENGAVAGIATGDMGVGKDGHHKTGFTRGMELRGKYTLFAEGARGSLTKTLIERFALAQDRQPQKFGIGLKELWQVAPEKHRRGLVQHTMGWPLGNRTGGGSFLYHFDDNLVSVGFVVHLELPEPVSVAVRGIPALQDPSADPRHVRRRQAHQLRRPRHHRRRLPVGAETFVSRRRADRLRRGLRQRAAHQGQPQRHAVGHARGRARCRGAGAGPRQRRACRLRSGVALFAGRPRSVAGAQRQTAVVETRHLGRRRARRARHVDQHARLLAVRHAQARQSRFRDA